MSLVATVVYSPRCRTQKIQPVCDLRATAIAAGICYGARITSPTASTYDDGARGVRGQTVLAEDFRMVSAARQRGALRIPDAAFLISIHHAGRNVRRALRELQPFQCSNSGSLPKFTDIRRALP